MFSALEDKKEIQACEKKIALLEEEQKKSTQLLDAGDLSPELLKALAHRQGQIEELETELLILLGRAGDHGNKR